MSEQDLFLAGLEKSLFEENLSLEDAQAKFGMDDDEFLKTYNQLKKDKIDPVKTIQEKINNLQKQVNELKDNKKKLEQQKKAIEVYICSKGGVVKMYEDSKQRDEKSQHVLFKAEKTLKNIYELQEETEKSEYEKNKQRYHKTLKAVLEERDEARSSFYKAYKGLPDHLKNVTSLLEVSSLYEEYVFLKSYTDPKPETIDRFTGLERFSSREDKDKCRDVCRLFLRMLRTYRQLERHIHFMFDKGAQQFEHSSWDGSYSVDFITKID